MSQILVLFAILFLINNAQSEVVSSQIYDPVSYIEKSNYLQMNVSYEPVQELFKRIQKTESHLQNRGEAHITVLTPKEFAAVTQVLSNDELSDLVLKFEIQKSKFDVVCIGLSKVEDKSAYYLVVESDDLFNLRKSIHQEMINSGGDANAFDPLLFYPHITIGFIKSDVHYEQGAIKDRQSCIELTK